MDMTYMKLWLCGGGQMENAEDKDRKQETQGVYIISEVSFVCI